MISQRYTFHNERTIDLRVDDPEFFQFVKETCGLQIDSNNDVKPDLDIKVYFHKKNSVFPRKKVGYNVYMDKGEILYRNRGFVIHAVQGNPFCVTVYVERERLWSAQYAYRILQYGFQGAKKGKYLEIVRNAVYMPLLYILERDGYVLLHGSAVLNPQSNKAYVFLGANHVGKTTTTLDLVYHHNFGFVSDNYILAKDNTIYPFPESVRATAKSLAMLAIQTKQQVVSEKRSVELAQKVFSPCQTGKLFFMHLGPGAELKPFGFAAALKRLNACHNYLGEFPEYSYLAFFPDFPDMQDLQKRVADFLQQPGLELYTFQAGPDIEENREHLLPYLT